MSDYDLLSLDAVSGKMQVRRREHCPCVPVLCLILNELVSGQSSDLCYFAAAALQLSGTMQDTGFFPRPDTNWDAFHQIQKLVLKNAGKM